MKEYIAVLKKYAVFSGRAGRKEFWMFTLVSFLVMFALSVLVSVDERLVYLSYIYNLAVLLPSLGVSFRRLHDTGHSAWWLLIGLVPLVGIIVLIVFYAQDSQPGSNQYGANPKGTPAPMPPAPAAPMSTPSTPAPSTGSGQAQY